MIIEFGCRPNRVSDRDKTLLSTFLFNKLIPYEGRSSYNRT